LTLITFALLALVIILGWNDIMAAFSMLSTVNLAILSLIVPVQILSYFAIGSIIFSYLRAKGSSDGLSRLSMARISLELNFVNHILPSGGAAGFSYLGWVLHRYGVSPSRSTIAQGIRYILTFVTFVVLLILSVIFLAIDHQMNTGVVIISIILGLSTMASVLAVLYLMHKRSRIMIFSNWVRKFVNKIVAFVTFKKKQNILSKEVVDKFFEEFHDDYEALLRDKKILLRPIIWAILANLLDVALIYIAFWSLGITINPALLFISFGVSSLASMIPITPGGTGVYEAIMIAFLSSAGVSPDAAIAGTLLARVSLLLGTVVFGYIFYQMRISTYGHKPS